MAGNDQGAVFMDPRGKSDFDAGLLFFAAAARMMPGLEWSDVTNRQFMAGWLTDLGKSVGNLKDGIGDVLKDTANFVASKGGETVRLAADPKVADTITRAGAAYATGGASEGARGALDSFLSIFTPTGKQTVETAGAAYKQSFGFDMRNPWVIGAGIGGTVLLVVLLARGGGGR